MNLLMNTIRLFRCLLLPGMVAALLLTACAPPPNLPAAGSGNLAFDLRRLQAEVSRQEQAVEELSQRLAAAELRLEGQAEELADLQRQQSQRAEGSLPGRPQTSRSEIGGPQPPATVYSGEAGPTEIYLKAFGDYASGRYQQAAEGFQTFLDRYPNNSYASNAQFWLGDCFFNQQDYHRAINLFQRLLDEYPRAPKAPDALLKIAAANLQLGNAGDARQAVETLTRRYPNSSAANKAADLPLP